MVTSIHRRKRREPEMLHKEVNITKAIHIYLLSFFITAPLKETNLHAVIITATYSWVGNTDKC